MTQRDPLQRSEILNTIRGFLRSIPRIGDHYSNDFKFNFLTSGITQYLDDYLNRAKIITIASIPLFFLTSALILTLFRWSLVNTILGAIATTLIGSSITLSGFIFYPYYRQHENRTRLEDGLIYFLSYMAVLSASGMSIERIIERIAEVEDNPPLLLLTKKFIMDIRLFGMDVRSALRDISEMSPSKILSKQIESMRTALATSGDLKSLLVYEVERQVQVKKEKLKAKINTLVYVGELYVALMVITPTIFIIVISVLSILGTSVGGGSIIQMNLIVFIGIPIMGGVFMLLLDQTLGREE